MSNITRLEFHPSSICKGQCHQIQKYDEVNGIFTFEENLNIPHGRLLPQPMIYHTFTQSIGWKYAMIYTIDVGEKTSVGWYDKEFGGIVDLFPTYNIKVSFRMIDEEEYFRFCDSSK